MAFSATGKAWLRRRPKRGWAAPRPYGGRPRPFLWLGSPVRAFGAKAPRQVGGAVGGRLDPAPTGPCADWTLRRVGGAAGSTVRRARRCGGLDGAAGSTERRWALRWLGITAVRRLGGAPARRYGGPAIRRPGSAAARQCAGSAAHSRASPAVGRLGSRPARRPGGAAAGWCRGRTAGWRLPGWMVRWVGGCGMGRFRGSRRAGLWPRAPSPLSHEGPTIPAERPLGLILPRDTVSRGRAAKPGRPATRDGKQETGNEGGSALCGPGREASGQGRRT